MAKSIYKKIAVLADYLGVDIDEIDIGKYDDFECNGNEYEVYNGEKELYDTAVIIERDLIYDNLFDFGFNDAKEFIEGSEIKGILNDILKSKDSLNQAIMDYISVEYNNEKDLFKLASRTHKIDFNDFDDFDDDEFYYYLQVLVCDYFMNRYKNNPIQFFLDNNDIATLEPYINEDDLTKIANYVVKRDGAEEWFSYPPKRPEHFTWLDGREYIIVNTSV